MAAVILAVVSHNFCFSHCIIIITDDFFFLFVSFLFGRVYPFLRYYSTNGWAYNGIIYIAGPVCVSVSGGGCVCVSGVVCLVV